MKHKTILAILAVALFAIGANAFYNKADFSGTWKLDKGKSEGLPPMMKDQTLVIKQTEDRIEVEIKTSTEMGEQTASDSYIFNGKENDIKIAMPGGAEAKGKRTSKWSSDANVFESAEEVTIELPDGAMKTKVTRTWQLSADGKTLTIDQTQMTPRGERKMKRVFVKA